MLAPHPTPLTGADARHLVRRLGFGCPPARAAALVGLSATDAVRRLLDEAAAAPALEDPSWMATPADAGLVNVVVCDLHRRMLVAPVREKLTMFWYNHFTATSPGVGNIRQLWRYYDFLRNNWHRSFRSLVYDVGKTPAMLRFLNGDQSRDDAPNQNYARELLELFTMGQYGPDGEVNYSEADVEDLSRAFTGFWVYELEMGFKDDWFDTGVKTVLGQTGAWGYDDGVRLLFEQRSTAIAHRLARKLLAFFLTHTPSRDAERALAEVILAADFEMRPVFEAFFESGLFFDPGYRGALVKGPIELFVGLYASIGVDPHAHDARFLFDAVINAGQHYFSAPNVAGWPGHNPPSGTGRPGYMAWYSTESYGPSWNMLGGTIGNEQNFVPRDDAVLLGLSPNLADPFVTALAVAEHYLPVGLEWACVPTVNAPFAGNASVPLPATAEGPAYVVNLAKLLLGPTPHYEWPALATASKLGRLRALLTELATEVPEFLLN